jgi:serine protease Do
MDNENRINEPIQPSAETENHSSASPTQPMNGDGNHGEAIPATPVFTNPIVTPPIPARVLPSSDPRFDDYGSIDHRPTEGIPSSSTNRIDVPLPPPPEPQFTEPVGNNGRFADANRLGEYQSPYYQQQNIYGSDELLPERKNKAKVWLALALIALLLFSSILAIQAAFRSKPTSNNAPTLPPPRVTSTAAPSPTELSNSFREISKAVKPAVVYINIVESASSDGGIFDQFGIGPQHQRQQASGSGFIVTNDGYILTNNHVVAKAEKIEVTLSDNRKYKGKVIGTDPETDLAVIKIDENNLPVANLGNSDDVQQGDWVLALGSPFGLQQTLTAGIVSATGREFGGGSTAPLGRFIQTDASINPGNSGGPLINMNAEVVGINSFIISQQAGFGGQGGSLGIGFAVTSNVARNVFNELVRKGKVTYGYLGVSLQNVDDAKAKAYGVEPNSGAFVAQEPTAGAPAAKAGLKLGDVITAFDGKKVSSSRELTDAVIGTPVGKTCQVEFIRDGQKQTVTVTVGERPAGLSGRVIPQSDQQPVEPQNTASKLGVTVQTVSSQMSEKLRVKGGAFIRAVTPGSPADNEGITHGDVIHRINRTPINTADDLLQAEKELKSGDEVTVMVERNGQINYIILTIE